MYAAGVAGRDDHAFVADSGGLQVLRVVVPPWMQRGADGAAPRDPQP